MSKTIIQTLVKESLRGIFEKAKSTPKKSDKKSDKEDDDKEEDENLDQSSVKHALEDDMAPSHISLCHKALGYSKDDATDRARCVHKIEKRHGQRLLKKELNALEGALGLK